MIMPLFSPVLENKVTIKADTNQSNPNSPQSLNSRETIVSFTPANSSYYSVESLNSFLICPGLPCPGPW